VRKEKRCRCQQSSQKTSRTSCERLINGLKITKIRRAVRVARGARNSDTSIRGEKKVNPCRAVDVTQEKGPDHLYPNKN